GASLRGGADDAVGAASMGSERCGASERASALGALELLRLALRRLTACSCHLVIPSSNLGGRPQGTRYPCSALNLVRQLHGQLLLLIVDCVTIDFQASRRRPPRWIETR